MTGSSHGGEATPESLLVWCIYTEFCWILQKLGSLWQSQLLLCRWCLMVYNVVQHVLQQQHQWVQAQVGGICGLVKIINHKILAGDGYRMNKVQELWLWTHFHKSSGPHTLWCKLIGADAGCVDVPLCYAAKLIFPTRGGRACPWCSRAS